MYKSNQLTCKMRKIILTALAAMLWTGAMAHDAGPEQIASELFREFSVQSALHADLWGRDLYGPMLLIDPQTGQMWANHPYEGSTPTTRSNVYTGPLPPEIPIANTAVKWNGIEWAVIIMSALTSLEDAADRVSLMAHESFHVVQPALGFTSSGGENLHLDMMEGRIALRLELEALRKALTTDGKEREVHLIDAFLFRAHRRALFSGADQTENALEMLEGIAEYTGEASSGRPQQDKTTHFEKNIDALLSAPSFVRSFAYATTAAYGWMLDCTRPGWNRQISARTDLTAFLIEAFSLTVPSPTEQVLSLRAAEYRGEEIAAQERTREQERQERMERYVDMFVTRPHLDIALEAMQITFNPNNIVSLEKHGTVYQTMTLRDNWGVLEVTEGALMAPNWNIVTVAMPFTREGSVLTGNGWRLELSENHIVTVDPATGNASVERRDKSTN